MKQFHSVLFLFSSVFFSCNTKSVQSRETGIGAAPVKPVVVTDTVYDDPDDPAIWVHPVFKDSSLILGTDKHKDNGGIYVFNLQGRIDKAKTVTGMKRVNNIDIAYGLLFGNERKDIAVATERDRNMIRIFILPEMKAADGGGIPVFENDTMRLPMGIALYTRPADNAVFAIVGRKTGPLSGYLEQYILAGDESGMVKAKLVRQFGKYSGKKEIESIAVDNELGFVYYSDEQAGIHKYFADPDKGDEELAFFGQGEFKEDNEGISFYKLSERTGYILVSDQSANTFNVYTREGEKGLPHLHKRIAVIPMSTISSDGSDMLSLSLPGFEGGLFVAMSDNKKYQFYRWKDMAAKVGLKIRLK